MTTRLPWQQDCHGLRQSAVSIAATWTSRMAYGSAASLAQLGCSGKRAVKWVCFVVLNITEVTTVWCYTNCCCCCYNCVGICVIRHTHALGLDRQHNMNSQLGLAWDAQTQVWIDWTCSTPNSCWLILRVEEVLVFSVSGITKGGHWCMSPRCRMGKIYCMSMNCMRWYDSAI